MEEMTKRNRKGVWLREIENVLKRFGASLEWLLESISLREEETDEIGRNRDMEVNEINQFVFFKMLPKIFIIMTKSLP